MNPSTVSLFLLPLLGTYRVQAAVIRLPECNGASITKYSKTFVTPWAECWRTVEVGEDSGSVIRFGANDYCTRLTTSQRARAIVSNGAEVLGNFCQQETIVMQGPGSFHIQFPASDHPVTLSAHFVSTILGCDDSVDVTQLGMRLRLETKGLKDCHLVLPGRSAMLLQEITRAPGLDVEEETGVIVHMGSRLRDLFLVIPFVTEVSSGNPVQYTLPCGANVLTARKVESITFDIGAITDRIVDVTAPLACDVENMPKPYSSVRIPLN